MTNVRIYDYDMERIDKICEKYDLTEHEVIELLLDSVEGEEDEVFK